MRIGIMLRAYDRAGGIGIYSRNIVKHLLEIDQQNFYLLIYNNEAHLGTYSHLDNVEEVFIPASHPLIWDQIAAPRMIQKWDIDIVFHTKFTVPLFLKSKKIMALHGASWYTNPELYGKADLFYVRRAMPVYCRQADFLISNSELTTRDYLHFLGLPAAKIRTVNLAAGEGFTPLNEPDLLASVKAKYNLPDLFALTVTSYEPRKNFSTLLKAFTKCIDPIPDLNLVVVGKGCERYRNDFKAEIRSIDHALHFPGWIEQEDLPVIYNLASAFIFPSVYEEFGIPVVEAMACGCPVIASNTGAIPDLTGSAALLCDPFDDGQFAENLTRILRCPDVAEACRYKGLEMAENFSWTKAACEVLQVFDQVFDKAFEPLETIYQDQ
jgi:glycosyltransferase involved in cell wall biosynthesis